MSSRPKVQSGVVRRAPLLSSRSSVLQSNGTPVLVLGRYPTPVQRLDRWCAQGGNGAQLWVKRDDLTNAEYGGNKVRKLEPLLGLACQRRVRRIVTIGATGSHHVLAATYFGRRAGIDVEAVLVPQPETAHAAEVLRASIAQGVRPFFVRSWAGVLPVVAWRVACGAHFVPIGGSSVLGTTGYFHAGRELADQVREGLLPEPDVCVVALGSGGTAAGLAIGLESAGLKTRVIGVCVSQPPWALGFLTARLARACARKMGVPWTATIGHKRLWADRGFLGEGYGHPTADGARAMRLAAEEGLTLDPTYTAKAFACALRHVQAPETTPHEANGAKKGLVVLYWHTLSSAPMAPLIGAPVDLQASIPEPQLGA